MKRIPAKKALQLVLSLLKNPHQDNIRKSALAVAVADKGFSKLPILRDLGKIAFLVNEARAEAIDHLCVTIKGLIAQLRT